MGRFEIALRKIVSAILLVAAVFAVPLSSRMPRTQEPQQWSATTTLPDGFNAQWIAVAIGIVIVLIVFFLIPRLLARRQPAAQGDGGQKPPPKETVDEDEQVKEW